MRKLICLWHKSATVWEMMGELGTGPEMGGSIKHPEGWQASPFILIYGV